MTAWTSGGDPLPYEPVLDDPPAAHRIDILVSGGALTVTCPCLDAGQCIEARPGAFPAGEAVAAWRAWHAEQGIEVTS